MKNLSKGKFLRNEVQAVLLCTIQNDIRKRRCVPILKMFNAALQRSLDTEHQVEGSETRPSELMPAERSFPPKGSKGDLKYHQLLTSFLKWKTL